MQEPLTLQEQVDRINIISQYINKELLNENIIIDKGYMSYPINRVRVYEYLEQLKNRVGEEKYNLLTSNQQKRDHNTYHMTILSPQELKILNKQIETPVFKTEPKFIGLGSVNSGMENQVYFIVVDWKEIQEYRNWLSLPDKDLHITLGFTIKDIFGVKKNKSTLVK